MIPEIGLLIAGYCGVRLIEILSLKDRLPIVKVFAALTLAVILLISMDLVMKTWVGEIPLRDLGLPGTPIPR